MVDAPVRSAPVKASAPAPPLPEPAGVVPLPELSLEKGVTVTLTAVETFPAGSVTVTSTRSASTRPDDVHVHWPGAMTWTLHTSVPSGRVTCTVDPGSAVPLHVTVPLAFCVQTTSLAPAGGVVSTRRLTGVPASSVPSAPIATGVIVLVPSGSAVVGVQVHEPDGPTVVSQTVFPAASRSCTVSPGAPVPVNVGVVSLVGIPSEGRVIVAGEGVATADDSLPAGSTSTTLTGNAVTGSAEVHVQLPDAGTAVRHTSLPSLSRMMIVFPGVPVPAHVTVASALTAQTTSVGGVGGVVSIVKLVGAPVVLLPAGSVAVGVTVVAPSGNDVVGVHDQAPLVTVVVQMVFPASSFRAIVSPSSPVPRNVGVVSFVADPPAGEVIVGAVGALVSTTTVIALPVLVFPAVSVAVGVIVVDPSGSGVDGVHDHAPFVTVVSQTTFPAASVNVIVEPFSPVPVNIGVVSCVAAPFTGAVISGAVGAVVSTVRLIGEPGVLLPTASVAVGVTVVAPCGSGDGGVHDQLPFATVVVQIVFPASSVKLTVEPFSPVPVKVGVVSLITAPSVGAVIVGAVGAVASTVIATGAESGYVASGTAGSDCVATRSPAPVDSDVIGVQRHEPVAGTVIGSSAHATGLPPNSTTTRAPGVPVPVIVGVPFVVDPADGAVIVAATVVNDKVTDPFPPFAAPPCTVLAALTPAPPV